MDAALRKPARERAAGRCEYCYLPQKFAAIVQFQIEHIRAKQHGGRDEADNLCLACQQCNCFKGPNLSGHDPQTDRHVSLFNPRTQSWSEHFRVVEGSVVGLTPEGCNTAALLQMNSEDRIELRMEIGDDTFR